jgi:hypothetical protein
MEGLDARILRGEDNTYTIGGQPLKIINGSIEEKEFQKPVKHKNTGAIEKFIVEKKYSFCGINYSLSVLKSMGIFFDKGSENWFMLVEENDESDVINKEFAHGGGANNNLTLRTPDDLKAIPRGGLFGEPNKMRSRREL